MARGVAPLVLAASFFFPTLTKKRHPLQSVVLVAAVFSQNGISCTVSVDISAADVFPVCLHFASIVTPFPPSNPSIRPPYLFPQRVGHTHGFNGSHSLLNTSLVDQDNLPPSRSVAPDAILEPCPLRFGT